MANLTVGAIRQIIKDLPDQAPVRLNMLFCSGDDLNVVLESLSTAEGLLDITVSILTDAELAHDKNEYSGNFQESPPGSGIWYQQREDGAG
jgi:hypothetical protein